MTDSDIKFGLSQDSMAIIHAIFKKYDVIEKAIIYGSRAKGNYKQGSDIDLTLFGKSLTTDHLMRIAQDLDNSVLPYLVDISVFDLLDNPNLRDHIQRVGIVFYNR